MNEIIRQDRFDLTDDGREFRRRARDFTILGRFDDYVVLPRNWLYAFRGMGHKTPFQDRLTRLCRKGLLGRFTHNGTRNRNEIMTYYRTEAGDAFMRRHGLRSYPRNPTNEREEQALIDIFDASIELGTFENPSVKMLKFRDLYDHPNTPARLRSVTNPFTIYLDASEPLDPTSAEKKGRRVTPDGRPFGIKVGNKSALFLKEVTRENTNHDAHAKKFLAYKEIWQRNRRYDGEDPLYTQMYGDKAAMLIYLIRGGPVMIRNVKRLAEEILGPTTWLLFKDIFDHTVHGDVQPVTTRYLTEPYERIGHQPFSLLTLSEVSNA